MGSSIDLSHVGSKIGGEDYRLQRDSVADLLNRPTTGFPGAQPVSFARHHLQELQKEDYFLCEKTDGIRCLLYLSQFIDEHGQAVETQFLIDRKNDYYYIARDAMHIPPEGDDLGAFHIGTLFDGELVLQKTRAGTRVAYLIFDMLAIDGENIMNKPFDKRFERARLFFYKPYRKFAEKYADDVAAQPFDIQLKDFQLPYGAEMMFKDVMPRLPHGNDGLIFTCVTTPYTSGTDRHILKWKPPHENTIDFRFEIAEFPMTEDEDGLYEDWDAQPEIHLLANHGDRAYQYFATLHLTGSEWEALKRLNQVLDGRIIECYRDSATAHWRPKVEEDGTPRFRDDKTDANHITTVESVLQSIKDAVSEQDLIVAARDIRAAYKERQAAKTKETQETKNRETAKAAQVHAHQQRQQQQHAQMKREAAVRREADVQREVEEDDGPKYDD
ncbi:hypothetical protein LTR36_008061 [Oleoguttula mirabilis]|uniref:mRNA-capping enzyme subunit alpha n=1 Tax=Oleoguttula mirabilis TaxID=1507867 RepID=A0AAV9J8W2_9PEZI|nr:hypothetical protein LTR36_008061 [Oleoguttula mirabilis]